MDTFQAANFSNSINAGLGVVDCVYPIVSDSIGRELARLRHRYSENIRGIHKLELAPLTDTFAV